MIEDEYVYVLLVCGGRTFGDRDYLRFILDMYLFKHGELVIVHGAANGADLMAEQWAKDREQMYEGYPAEWRKLGKAAGFKRNKDMLYYSRACEVAAFEGGRGTINMVNIAKRENVLVSLWGWKI